MAVIGRAKSARTVFMRCLASPPANRPAKSRKPPAGISAIRQTRNVRLPPQSPATSSHAPLQYPAACRQPRIPGLCSRHLPRLLRSLANQFSADRKVIAESAKSKPLAQPCRSILIQPISPSCRWPRPAARPWRQVSQHLFHPRHADQVQLIALFGNGIAASPSESPRSAAPSLPPECQPAGTLRAESPCPCSRAANTCQGNLEPRHPLHAGSE